MDDIINTLINDNSDLNDLEQLSKNEPYKKDRIAELDAEYKQTQEKLLKTVQKLTSKKDQTNVYCS